MTLGKSQLSLFTKATRLGSGKQGVELTDEACLALLAIAARDLDALEYLPEVCLRADGINLFSGAPSALNIRLDQEPLAVFSKLVASGVPDVDMYFSCLAALHKGRLKYERILATQPVPTIDQVGPRGLLMYGLLPTDALAALLLWRKWIFDIDNRAGQETGYVFEPILAGAIGGTPASATKSPVHRRADRSKGRQVDCIVEQDKMAYEFKLRVTIAASGQGRWSEELEFPQDCKDSGFIPALVVLDPTSDPKLTQLQSAFLAAGGRAFIGDDAWNHLESKAGPSMGVFVEKYIRAPLADILAHAPDARALPDFCISLRPGEVAFTLGDEPASFPRAEPDPSLATGIDVLPEDVAEQLPGV